jgi:hypothetical protein
MHLERAIPSQSPEDILEGRDPDPPFMRFRPDRGKFFAAWTSGVRREPNLQRVRCDGALVPIDAEDVDPLNEAIKTQDRDRILAIVRKYVLTKALGPPADMFEGHGHEIPDGTILCIGSARLADKPHGWFSENSYPSTLG